MAFKINMPWMQNRENEERGEEDLNAMVGTGLLVHLIQASESYPKRVYG